MDFNTEQQWQAVLTRDISQDGRLYYGVKTTGVYCRPSCPSRRPRRQSVEFFSDSASAERAGYRPCRRCRPTEINRTVRAVQAACRFIREHTDEPLTLADLARAAGASPYHLQRSFKRLVGITPRKYHQALRVENLRRELNQSETVTEAIYAAGFGSSSRVYERAPSDLGMTPRQYQRRGAGTVIRFAVFDSSLGKIMLAAAGKGICSLRFGDSEAALRRELTAEFSAAQIIEDPQGLALHRQAVLRFLDGESATLSLPLDIRATVFQHRVWEALRAIPAGETRSYQEVAAAIGRPSAVRAVARACARNPVALAVPCHRVVRQDGDLAGYRWGVNRKAALLQLEQRHASRTGSTSREK